MTAFGRFETLSEERFSRYLSEHGYQYEYSPLVLATGKRPDFCVQTRHGPVTVEVTEINAEPDWPNASDGEVRFVAAPDWKKLIARKVSDKLSQVAQLDMPTVLLLAFPRCWPDPTDFIEAMFGQLYLGVPLNGGKSYLGANGAGARMQPGRNTRWSALAHLVPYNPSCEHVHAELAAIHAAEGPSTDVVTTASRVYRARQTPAFDKYERAVRLRVFDNPYAQHPLSRGIFEGPRDERYAFKGDDQYGLVWEGEQVPTETPSWETARREAVARADVRAGGRCGKVSAR